MGVGCSPAPSQSAWIRSQGGLAGQPQLAKAHAALDLLGREQTRAVRVSILNSDAAGAYAWPAGDVFVTRGLVDLLDQQELAAALAHEIGHLIADHALNPPTSLHGSTGGDASELAADATGAALLANQGIKRSFMISMLRKVSCSPSISPGCRKSMQERIAILSR